MPNVSEFASSAEERVLTGVKMSQTLVLDGIKNTLAFADRVVPESVSNRVEDGVKALPAAAPLVDGYFGFATKLLKAQKEFAGEVVEMLQPSPAPAPKSAKKAPARKSTRKSTARKTTKAA